MNHNLMAYMRRNILTDQRDLFSMLVFQDKLTILGFNAALELLLALRLCGSLGAGSRSGSGGSARLSGWGLGFWG